MGGTGTISLPVGRSRVPDRLENERTGIDLFATCISLMDPANSHALSLFSFEPSTCRTALCQPASLCFCRSGYLLNCPPQPKDYVPRTEPAPLCLTSPHMKGFTEAPARVDLLQGWHLIHANLSLQQPTSVDTTGWYIASARTSATDIKQMKGASNFFVLLHVCVCAMVILHRALK